MAKVVSDVTVYQRTPIWVSPKFDHGIPKPVQAAFAALPLTQRAVHLETATIDRADETGIVTVDGNRVDIDVLLLATGFNLWDVNFPVIECQLKHVDRLFTAMRERGADVFEVAEQANTRRSPRTGPRSASRWRTTRCMIIAGLPPGRRPDRTGSRRRPNRSSHHGDVPLRALVESGRANLSRSDHKRVGFKGDTYGRQARGQGGAGYRRGAGSRS
ncbi:MAG TPA: hypothetical protein VFE65_00775 [Pseudonocardia sp.]|nr:hypothetical protein [Pseudonocardia sp.]